jgi:hypothetical protein
LLEHCNAHWPSNGRPVKVDPLLSGPDYPDWARPYACAVGAPHVVRRKMRGLRATAIVLIVFHTSMAMDKIDLVEFHRASYAIDE